MQKTYLAEDTRREMARLIHQARLLTEAIGQPFPSEQWRTIRRVLDIGCGPGGWTLDMSKAHPDTQFVGIDNNPRMIETAQQFAHVEQLSNAQFVLMDARQPTFADGSFELIHCRLANSFLDKQSWPRLVEDCFRMLSSGGMLLLIDLEAVYTNSRSLETSVGHLYEIHKRAGRSYGTLGMSIGITFMFRVFLQQAGFHVSQLTSFLLDISRGVERFEDWCEDILLLNATFRPYSLKLGISTEAELDQLREEILSDMKGVDFSTIVVNVGALGTKP